MKHIFGPVVNEQDRAGQTPRDFLLVIGFRKSTTTQKYEFSVPDVKVGYFSQKKFPLKKLFRETLQNVQTQLSPVKWISGLCRCAYEQKVTGSDSVVDSDLTAGPFRKTLNSSGSTYLLTLLFQ